MGYTTKFEGVLKFTNKPGKVELAYLKTFLGADPDEIDDLITVPGEEYDYIQFELTKDGLGIQWDGDEKFRNAVNVVNLIIRNMRAEFPSFGLEGQLEAKGEEMTNRWILAIENGFAVRKKVNVSISESVYECPHCGRHVSTEVATKIK